MYPTLHKLSTRKHSHTPQTETPTHTPTHITMTTTHQQVTRDTKLFQRLKQSSKSRLTQGALVQSTPKLELHSQLTKGSSNGHLPKQMIINLYFDMKYPFLLKTADQQAYTYTPTHTQSLTYRHTRNRSHTDMHVYSSTHTHTRPQSNQLLDQTMMT